MEPRLKVAAGWMLQGIALVASVLTILNYFGLQSDWLIPRIFLGAHALLPASWNSFGKGAVFVMLLGVFVGLFFIGKRVREEADNGIPEDDAPELPLSESPVQQLKPIRFGQSVTDLRTEDGVRELTNSENDLRLYHLPNGVYGWQGSFKIETPSLRILLPKEERPPAVAESDTQLRKIERWRDDVEIHKDREGTIRIVGFVTDSTRLALQRPTRNEPVELIMTFREYGEYKCALSIPRERFSWFAHREFADGEEIADAKVA